MSGDNFEDRFEIQLKNLSTELLGQGMVHLKDWFKTETLDNFKAAADKCFEAVETEPTLAERFGFNRFSHSVPSTALLDFGVASTNELMAPLSTPGLAGLVSEALGCDWQCNLDQSWVRKKFAPKHTPSPHYHNQGWHQDGALGVSFPKHPDPQILMTRMLTCWIPLNPCGVDSPGLEFILGRQPRLLHFSELDDASIQNRFPLDKFMAPSLAVGDGLIFLNGVLHRTHILPEMPNNRISLDYRIFPLSSSE